MIIYVNIVCLWWTCVIENGKVDDMLFNEKRCDGVLMWKIWLIEVVMLEDEFC